VTFEGEFYQVKNLQMTPRLAPELFPGILISGSSEAGMAAAKAIEATPVEYPAPPNQCSRSEELGSRRGLRVGIVARQDAEEAWRIAEERFPPERKGQLTHQLAMKVSDSKWHKQLSDVGDQLQGKRDTYWLVPFQNYKTFCPYLVGSYEEVAAELSRYMQIGYRTFILDIPPNEEELRHIGTVFSHAAEAVTE
jgi:alkanesulfonate monooxygenase